MAEDRCVNGCFVLPANLIIFKEDPSSDICLREMVGEEVGMGAVAKRVVDGQAVIDTDIGDRNEGREVTSDKEVIHNTDKIAAINLVNC